MIYTLLADGFEEIEALAVVDILRRADIGITTVSAKKDNCVTGAHNITVKADITIDEIDKYDGIFLPGGYPGYENLEKNERVISLIKEAYKENKLIAAICAAPSILGKLGILEGRTACCFPSFEKYLTGANVTYDKVCVSDNIITSRGAGTAHELAFTLVEIIKGDVAAEELAKAMLYI